ncbi:hypothetical protein T484DRAFT_2485528 [Baffinella frigidus]|nr:hypothetical protein T484DRAFT_2485528 [Cryptophyta sp. CCMP2293]
MLSQQLQYVLIPLQGNALQSVEEHLAVRTPPPRPIIALDSALRRNGRGYGRERLDAGRGEEMLGGVWGRGGQGNDGGFAWQGHHGNDYGVPPSDINGPCAIAGQHRSPLLCRKLLEPKMGFAILWRHASVVAPACAAAAVSCLIICAVFRQACSAAPRLSGDVPPVGFQRVPGFG